MTKKKISNDDVKVLSNAKNFKFPIYTSQIINMVNGVAQGTRAKVVGQMSELIQEFDGKSIDEWEEWYKEKNPNAIDDATEKIYSKFLAIKAATNLISKDTIRNWVEDLVITKTYCGLKFQEAILIFLAKEFKRTYRLATPAEESKNIDGYLDDIPLQIKSSTYRYESRLNEIIDVPIVYYEKKKDGIVIEYNELDFA